MREVSGREDGTATPTASGKNHNGSTTSDRDFAAAGQPVNKELVGKMLKSWEERGIL